MTVQLDPADLDALQAAIKGGGFDSVSYEPGEVRAPGVWIRIDSIGLSYLADGVADTSVSIHLIAPERPFRQALGTLLPMLDKLVDVLTPAGPITPAAVTGAGSSTALPALRVPFVLHTSPEEE